jgi:hypothetical protein
LHGSAAAAAALAPPPPRVVRRLAELSAGAGGRLRLELPEAAADDMARWRAGAAKLCLTAGAKKSRVRSLRNRK